MVKMAKIVGCVLLLLVSACAGGRETVAGPGGRVEIDWPAWSVDRYEPVVFPAGPVGP